MNNDFDNIDTFDVAYISDNNDVVFLTTDIFVGW